MMVHDYTVDKVWDKIKRIGIEKPDNIWVLKDTDNKFADDIALKNAVIWMKCVIYDDDKSYSQLLLDFYSQSIVWWINTTQGT